VSNDQNADRASRPSPDAPFAFESIVGGSSALREAIDLATKVATSRIRTLLLVGETGTGKELFARGIHYASANSAHPFVAVNCAAIPENLLESELFGHERGAFTGAHTRKQGLLELAGDGTILLDEVAELPLPLQAKLLRVLGDWKIRRVGGVNEQEIGCRIIAATNVPLESAVANKQFREDLFYRLNVFRVILPPLRERRGDIAVLAAHFAEQAAREHDIEPKTLSREALDTLEIHSWPGNVRELKNVIERAIVLSESNVIGPEHITVRRRSAPQPVAPPDANARWIRIPDQGMTLEDVIGEAIRHTLQITGGNQSEASRILDISRPTLLRRVRKLGLA
jgi:two-component system NtrC family response regulator